MVDHKNVIVSKKLVMINSASSLLAKIVNVTVLLWMYQYLLKRITAEEFAVLPVVTSLMVFAPLFFSFFTGGISRYVVEAYAKGDFSKVTQIVSSIFPLLAGMAAVFVVLGGVFAFNIDHVFNIPPLMVGPAKVMMLLLVGNFALQMLAAPFLSGFHVRQKYVELNLLGIARDFLRIILLLVFLLGIGPQVIWVVLATTIAETAHSIVTVIRARQLVPELLLRRSGFVWAQARELTSFGLWTTLGRLGGVMYTNAATILLNLYGSAVDVTSYHIGATFFRQIDTTVSLASQPLQPALTAMHALEDKTRLGNTVLRGGRYALWVTLAVATPLTIYATSFIDLYLGDAYSQAAIVTILFMIIFPFTGPTALLAMTAMAMGQVRAFFLPAFLFQLGGLIMMIYMVTQTDMGAPGMALSLTVITVASQLSYYWPLCLRLAAKASGDFLRKLLVPGLSPAFAGGVVWLGIHLARPIATWTDLIVYGGVGAVVYAGVLFAFCLNENERRDLGCLRQKLKARFSG